MLKDFLVGLWFKDENFKIQTFYLDATDNDDLSEKMNFKGVEPIFNLREKAQKRNIISFSVDELNEGIIISIKAIENSFNTDSLYELMISPGGGHTLKNQDRYTDFSFYLNIILPRIKEMGCQVGRIICEDLE